MAETNDYKIPFGINAGDFFKSLREIDKSIQDTESNVNEANKSMRDGFVQTGKQADELKNKFKADAEAAVKLREVARELGKELNAAFSVKGKSKEIEELASKFQNEIFKVQKNAKIKLDVVFNEATIKEIANAVAAGSDELQAFNTVLDQARIKLQQLDPNSEEFQQLNQQLQLSEGLLQGLGESEKIAETGSKSLKAQLRELKNELAAMEEAGKGGTQEFIQMSVRAGQLEDQIGDVAARVRVLASDTKYLDAGVQAITALAGGFAVAQGAAALFGTENETVNEALKKVTAAMAILQGVQAVANALNKDSALNVLLFSRAQTTKIATTVADTAATTAETTATVAADVATKSWTASLLANPFTAIIALIAILVAAIYTFVSATDDAEDSTKRLNEALETQALLLSLQESTIRRRTELLVAQAKAQGKSEEDITKIQQEGLVKRLAAQQEHNQEMKRQYDLALQNRELSADDFKKISDAALESDQRVKDTENQIQVKGYEAQAANNKRSAELRKKALEDAKKSAEESKKILEQINAFRKALQDATLQNMKEGFDKQRLEARNQVSQQIADLQKDVALSSEAEVLRNKAIIELRKSLTTQLAEIDKEESQARAATELAASQMIIDLQKDSLQKELNALNLERAVKINQIQEDFKGQEQTIISAQAELEENINRRRTEIKLKYAQENLKTDEERELISLNILTGFAEKSPKVEEAKQREILNIKIKYAKLNLDALLASGKAQDDIEVLRAKESIGQLEQQLSQVSANNQYNNIFEIFGIDSKNSQGLNEAFGSTMKAFKEVTDFIVAQYQRQIDARTRNIESIDKEIEDLETQLEREYRLRDEGYASNVKLIEKEIAQKEKQKEEEIRQRREIFEEQKRIQRLQIIADTATQASSLIVAIANLYKNFSNLPYGIGIAIATGLAAGLVGTFISTKAKFQALNNQTTQYEGGGWIDGKPHSQGGKKYYANDGSVTELEAGEHVTNKSQSAKFGPLLDAINTDKISGMSDAALSDLLKGTGIRFEPETMKSGIREARERDSRQSHSVTFSTDELPSIDNTMKELLKNQKGKPETWEDKDYFYKKSGNIVTRTRKK